MCKLAKEKGFPQEVSRWRDFTSPSRNYYNHKGELNGDCLEIIKCIYRKEEVPIELQTIAAPTQSLLQRWLREEKKMYVCPFIITDYEDDFHPYVVYWSFVIVNVESGDSLYREYERIDEKRFDTYELALEDALKYALENLI